MTSRATGIRTRSALAIRLIGSAGAVAVAALATAGCSMLTPQATTFQSDGTYTGAASGVVVSDPADGVSANLGDLKIRNVIAVADDSVSAVNIIFSAINTGTATITLQYSAPTTSGATAASIDFAPGLTSVGDGAKQLVVTTPQGAALGGLYPVTFTADGADSVTVQVPVLNATGRDYLTNYVPKSAS